MNFLRIIPIPGFLVLAACASHEGVYEPACAAYEGDRLELKSGRFEWQRFTDERRVDDEGNVVAPFPGFPRSGTYRETDGRLELLDDDQVRLDDWFIVDSAEQRFLLTAKQRDAFLDSGTLPECALKLAGAGSR